MSDPTPVPAAPAPKSGGSSALKIILIILGSIVLLFLLAFTVGIYACSHFVHKAIQKHGDKTTIRIPGAGSFSANEGKSYSAAELGVDIYPGARPEEGGSSLDLPTSSMITAVFSSADPVSKVDAFYKDKFGSSTSDYNSSGTAILSKKLSNNESVTVTISSKDQQDGRTKIVILHIRKK